MNISYEQVAEYGNEIHRIAGNMKEILSNIQQINSSSCQEGNWNGIGAERFQVKMKKLIDSFETVYQEMEMCVLFMADSTEGYQAVDQQVIAEICANLNITSPNYQSSNIFLSG